MEGSENIGLGLRASIAKAFDKERDGAGGGNGWLVHGRSGEGQKGSCGVLLEGLIGRMEECKKWLKCTSFNDLDLVPVKIKP